ncbi:hypothetical protein SADUNF_Sadunf01G0030100 [Salix dunnii]|uniref:Uncharacterized protein n=1 Tax=Salix dunnii TaxID=1413687 RepID=A0A835NA48_9ROSI|nr:hypothetical protein SADUNF_Sadunf01G0030100 [Salix dunnii]
MATAPTAAKVAPAVIVGVGRVGMALQEMGSGQDFPVKRGESMPTDFEGTILIGMLEPWLQSKGLGDADQVKESYGFKAFDKEAFQKQMLEKLIWISAFMLVGARHPGATVGVVEKEFCSERSIQGYIKMNQLGPNVRVVRAMKASLTVNLDAKMKTTGAVVLALCLALSRNLLSQQLQKRIVFEGAIEERLCACALAVAHFPTAVKGLQIFANLSFQAFSTTLSILVELLDSN